MSSSADFLSAYNYVSKQLDNLDQTLFYHGKHHTIDDVVPCAIFLCQEEGLNEQETLLVKTAALYHDIGFLDQYEKNEPKGCEWAKQSLPGFGYTQEEIDAICKIIMATQMPQNPKNHLSEIMCDADLGHLGSVKYFLRAESLRLELELVHKKDMDLKSWIVGNIKFLENHKYFTKSANKHFKEIKESWIEKSKNLMSL